METYAGPRFLVPVDNIDDSQILIPYTFRRTFLRPIPRMVTISYTDGLVWVARIHYVHGSTYISCGWTNIRRFYGFAHGDTVEFVYNKDSHFDIFMHLRIGIERVMPKIARICGLQAYKHLPRIIETTVEDLERRNGFTQAQVDAVPSVTGGSAARRDLKRKFAAPEPSTSFIGPALFSHDKDPTGLALFLPHFFFVVEQKHITPGIPLKLKEDFAKVLVHGSNEIYLLRKLVGGWPIRCIRTDKGAGIVEGWEDFANYNQLAHGDAVNFDQNVLNPSVWNVTISKQWTTSYRVR